jgi:Ca-activated chloride channel family protein
MNNDQHDDLQDRLMDIALRRKFGAEKPGSIAEKIGDVTALRPAPLMSRTWFRLLIAATVLMAVTVAIGSRPERWGNLAVVRVVDRSQSTEPAADYSLHSPSTHRIAEDSPFSFHGKTTVIRGSSIIDEPDEEGEENETVIQEGSTVQLPVDAKPGEYARLDSQARRIRDLIKEEHSLQRDDASKMNVTVKQRPGAKSASTTPGSPSVSFRADSIYGESKSSPGEGIIVYNLPATGERYDRTPVLPPEDSLGGRFQFDVSDGRPFAIDFEQQGRDRFARVNDNRFLAANDNPLSTFSIDVDTASYSVIRSRIEAGQAPPPAAVRVEELINYFSYNYPQPTDDAPFAVHVDVAACPWKTSHRLVRIGLKGKEIAKADRPASNLVFLVDVSGSMQPQNKLPLVRQGLLRLVGELDERDRVAIVVYAGNSGCVLASTPCTQSNKERIRSAIAALESGGSTNGEAGIQLAYQIAQDHFVKGGANRVILCTDGDFNVGTTDDESLKKLVADRAKSGVFLTALGFGMGNHNDQMLEAIADNGNGTYGYIDDEREVEKLFVRQLSGTLITIAKDVKIQVEFNPAQVGAYRLIGYENRILAHEDFNNDKKDAGDIGAGHTVTALYEIVPPAALAEANKLNAAASEGTSITPGAATGGVDALEFQRPKQELELTDAAKNSGDMLLVKLRYKAPDGDTSTLIRTPAKDNGTTFAAANSDFKFASSVAGFGMYLRQSPFRSDITLAAVEEIANANLGEDADGQRKAFVDLVRQVRGMTGEGRGARD